MLRAAGSRREMLAGAAIAGVLLSAQKASAFEWFGMDVARKVLRPDGEEQEAIVALMDARSTLKELAELAATPLDSEERFKSRYLLPAYAKRLREVAASAPVLSQSIAGDKESTLSEKYGGTGQGSTLTDPVFESLGKILTISGRTIKEEAQVNPAIAKEGAEVLTTFLSYLPEDKLAAAQEFRIQRAQRMQQ